MKFSESWLREWVNPGVSTQELVAQLTMAGLEVDGVEPAAAAFSGVVIGEVLDVQPHPDADKLRVCQVNAGAEPVADRLRRAECARGHEGADGAGRRDSAR
jgi:phenylalanyl-tRNA synthetase beta chain